MARLKPDGIRLRAWRALREEQRQNALLLCGDREQQRSELQRLDAIAPAWTAPPQTCVERPQLARSRRQSLDGALDGWVLELRRTATGRKYKVFLAPSGEQFFSRASSLRSLGLAAA